MYNDAKSVWTDRLFPTSDVSLALGLSELGLSELGLSNLSNSSSDSVNSDLSKNIYLVNKFD